MKLILEQRYLFDGSVGAVGHHATHVDLHDSSHPDTHPAAIGQEEAQPAAAPPPAAPEATGSPANITTVLIVDPRVTNWQSLAASVKPGIDVVLLDPAKDGIAQVTRALQGMSGVTNLEFLTDGTPGAVSLGGTSLDMPTLTARAADITGWSAHLAAHADIVFWGCDVGAGSIGAAFVADMHTLTGATIGASSDATGAAALGGNWTLEVTTGSLHADVQPFAAATLARYSGILDTPDPTVTLSAAGTLPHTAAGTVLLGDTIHVSLSFANTATNATGYGSYIELFAPTSLTLSGTPSYNGAALTTLSAAVTGGSLTNPLTHLLEAAPSGITGGTAYFITLPYGSFTPAEPAVDVSASLGFSPGAISQLAGLVGQPLLLEARGGFEYGAVATGGTPILENASSLPTATESVVLVESWLTVGTVYGESETATGPDFPVAYTLNLEPAPGVASTGVPITHLSLAVPLPNDIIETGAPVASGGGSASVANAAVAGGTEQTVNVSYASLSGTQSVTWSAYVPEFYQYDAAGHTAGTPILDPASGAAVPIAINPSYTYSADPWNGIANSNVAGDVTGATFEAKSLAAQLVADTTSALPTQDIHYTERFQVSDYFGILGLGMSATLGNGLTFDPAVTPTLSVTAGTHGGVSGSGSFSIAAASETTALINAETIQTAGSGSHFSYAYAGGSGTTALAFDVAGLLPGLYGAGATGAVTFAATVLDSYPVGTDQVPGAGGFLREADSVSTSGDAVASALFDYNGSAYTPAGTPISDNTAAPVDTLPQGSLSMSVVDVDGVAYTGQTILPGQVVVYQLVYSLAAPGDFASMDVSAYVPEPVFSVLHPAAPDTTTAADFAGTGSSTFIHVAGANAATLGSGTYNYAVSPGLAGVQVTGGTGSEPTNSVAFSVLSPGGQAYYNGTTSAGAMQSVTIDFAVTASSLPYVDGLRLTGQGDSTYTPAVAAPFASQTTQTLSLGEPLLSVQQGVVSIVNDSNTDISTAPGIVWSRGASSASAASALFATAGSGSVFAPGTTVPSVLTPAADHLDVAGAQAGDTVRIVDAVQNTGHFAAYDVILKDALAQGLSTSNVSDLTFTRGDGTTLVALNPATGLAVTGSAAIQDYFAGGVLLTVAGSTATPVLASSGTSGVPGDIVFVTYGVKLPAATATAASLTGNATVVAWTNQDVYAANGTTYTLTDPVSGTDANFTGDPAIGPVPTDTVTVATAAPSVTDTITGAEDGSDAGLAGIPANTFPTHAATVVPGETVQLSATISLPQGQTTNLSLTDILPAGLQMTTASGNATYTDSTGSHLVPFTVSGNTLTLAATNFTVAPAAGGDAPATITFNYQALAPQTQASAVDTSLWGTNAVAHDTTLTDHFNAPTEGLRYATTTATSTQTTSGAGSASGVANAVTVTNPLVTAGITETGGTAGQTVYSGETLTYQLSLSNASTTATAYDLGALVSLPPGLTYRALSLTQTAGAPAQLVTDGNVGSNGVAGGGNALDGITLAPGASSTFTFQATVNNNLPAGTALTVTAQPAWESLPARAQFDGAGNVNPQAQAYAGAQGSVSNSVASLSPTLSVIGESNGTAGLGTSFNPNGETSGSAVGTTDSEIVRMRAVLQVPEGQNTGADIVVTLPNGLTFQNGGANLLLDGSTTVALISPAGQLTSSLLSGVQQSSSSVVLSNLSLSPAGSTDPVTAQLPVSAISVNGQTATFSLGTLTDNESSALGNYVVVEFNAVVPEATAATSSPLPTTMHADANGVATATVSDYATVVAPRVVLGKTIENVAYNPDGSATVTYLDTETNIGNAPAYDVRLTDPGAGTGTVAYVGTSGTNAVTAAGPIGSEFDSVVTTLPANGGSQSFRFTATLPAGAAPNGVSDATSQAVATSFALNPAHETGGQETLAGTSLTPVADAATATAGLDVISGTVNQDTSTGGNDSSLAGLPDQTVSVTFGGQTGTEATTTDGTGHYSVLVPDNGLPVTLTAATIPATNPITAPNPDNLDNRGALLNAVPGSSESGLDPAVLSFTPAARSTTATFDFWRPLDTAPALANGPLSALTTLAGSPIVPFAGATVSDAQLDGAFAHDFSGTTLTLQRYVGPAAAPDATDLFTGTGTPTSGAYLSNGGSGTGNVLLAGAAVGAYSEAGGVLTIRFSSAGVTAATVDGVLQGVAYASTLSGAPLVPGIVIGAQIDDANNDPVPLHGNARDSAGPHDQGPGGDLLSNVLTATIDVNIAGSTATFIEPNDASPSAAPSPVAVDPLIDLTNIAHTNGTPTQITLAITNPHAEDVLTFANTSDIAGTYANGVMTLTSVAGRTPTLAAWQAAVRSVQYYDSSDVPNAAIRSVAVTVTSGANATSEAVAVAVVPVNDSPVLDSNVPVSLNDSTEYQGTGAPVPSGAVGTLVSQLVGLGGGSPGNVTDPDGAGLMNGSAPTAPGIAVTGFSTRDAGGLSVGAWYYSINGGTTWTAFPATISAMQPLDLSPAARVAFQATTPEFNGQIPNAITFRAWDGFDGAANGAQAALAGAGVFGQSAASNTAATAYSIATDTLPLTIDNINNAPLAQGAPELGPVSTAEQHPPGLTVKQLFGGDFADPLDQQASPAANPTGSASNRFAGIAVTANAATPAQGVWEYSLNGGQTWVAIPANVSPSDAVILPAAARLAFQPTGGFSGHPGQLSVHLIDSSATTIAPGLTGAGLAAEGSGGVPLAATTGVGIAAFGGSTAFSQATIPLGTLVNPLTPIRLSHPAEPVIRIEHAFPDDSAHAPTDVQLWTTDDYRSMPLIPDLSVVGSAASRFIIEMQPAVVSVPPNIFVDSLPDAQLTFEAELPGGTPLPSWLTFNPDDLTFSGTPPRGSHGRVEILIRARDIAGNTADANFSLLIGREQRDLVGLLRPRSHNGHLSFPVRRAGDPADGLKQAIMDWPATEPEQPPRHAPADLSHHAAIPDRIAAQAALLAALPASAQGSGGFSAALHAAGPMSALGRARSWLDRMNDIDRHQPAA